MSNRRYDSLRNKLLLPFALLGFIVSALLSALTHTLVADLEERSVQRMLQFELENFRYRRQLNPKALLPSTTVVRGFFLPSKEFPDIRADAEANRFFSHYKKGRHYTVLIGDIDGKPLALLYDSTISDVGQEQLGWLLVGGVFLMTLLSGLVGNRLAGQVVRPIARLLRDISEKSNSIDPRTMQAMGFTAEDYPNNEIGGLVLALDRFAERLMGYAQRESYFASDVSHELRTPVAVIRGAAEILVEEPNLREPVRQRLQTIHRQSVRMTEMLEAMLLLAREQPETTDPACDIAEVIEDAVADVQPTLSGRPVSLRCTINERPIVPAERPLAYVVISNLLRNACTHTREGLIQVRLFTDRAEVEDTGIGIPRERFAEIFHRHVKGDSSPGTGLGLSIVARITEVLGWTIDLSSQPGAGTRVTIHFSPPTRNDTSAELTGS